MDGGKRSYDRPPTEPSEPLSTTCQIDSYPPAPEPQVSPAPHPSVASTSHPAPHAASYEIGQAPVPSPAVEPTSDVTERHSHLADPMPASAESLTNPAVDLPESGTGYQQPEAMSRPLKVAYAIVLGVLAVSVLGLAYVHLLHHSDDGHSTASPPTTSAHVTATSAHVTTTTAALPTTLSPSAQAAATALISSWSTNNRSAALAVATPTAVGALFSVPYASGLAIARGCSTSFSPIVCTFGPPGGASPTDAIYQIKVSQVEGGWYASSVTIEN